MASRKPPVEIEDSFSDADYESWQQVSDDLGTKITWDADTPVLTLRYLGLTEVKQENSDEVITAALWADSKGEKYFSWLPWALSDAIESGRIQDKDIVRIEYKGEAPTGKGLNPVKKFDIRVKPRS